MLMLERCLTIIALIVRIHKTPRKILKQSNQCNKSTGDDWNSDGIVTVMSTYHVRTKNVRTTE